ncbi:MAG TPA: hypothetical protein VFU94_02135 [Conexibacter sp.]|nr:hypothetical protein [Conexibacter sp.]
MSTRARLLLAAAVTIAVLGCAVGAAGARRLNFEQQNFRIVWARMSITGNARVECSVTMEGSFHSRTITKVLEERIGVITRAMVNQFSCMGGNYYAYNGMENLEGVVVGQSLPWHVYYEGFTGILPNIAGIVVSVEGVTFLVDILGVHCRYISTELVPAFAVISVNTTGTHEILNWKWREERRIPIERATPGCAERAELAGAGTYTLLGNSIPVSVTLI